MKYFELKCKVYLKKDIQFKDSFEAISKYISYALSKDKKLLEFHDKNKFKYYVFNSFYPLEKEQNYKSGKIYEFKIRSIDEIFINKLLPLLKENINNPLFLIVDIVKIVQKKFFIKELYSLTPVIATLENGKYWTFEHNGDIMNLQKLLHYNLEKKYKEFYKKELVSSQNFIQLIEIKNQKPQSIYVSLKNKKTNAINNIRFMGNKFKIIPNEDKVSQQLALIALGAGLGEKNSFGGGFCLGKGIRLW